MYIINIIFFKFEKIEQENINEKIIYSKGLYLIIL